MEYKIEQIKEKLKDRKITYVAEEMGVSHTLLYRIMRGEVKNMTFKTYNKIMDYFNEQDK